MKVRAPLGPTSVVMKALGKLGFRSAKVSSFFLSFLYSVSSSGFFSNSFSMFCLPVWATTCRSTNWASCSSLGVRSEAGLWYMAFTSSGNCPTAKAFLLALAASSIFLILALSSWVWFSQIFNFIKSSEEPIFRFSGHQTPDKKLCRA